MAEEAVFSFILETLRQLLIKEGKFLLGVNRQLGELEDQLKAMRWFLSDGATNQEGANSRALEWVIRVRDLAYEAEHVIETYALNVKSCRGGGVTGKIKRFACILNECYLRHQIGFDIDPLLKKITALRAIFHDYGIREVMEQKDGGSSRQPLLRRTYSNVNPHMDLFVGLENDIEILAGSIIGEEYRVVSICGMGGIGKTTLARKVYHHPSVRSHFDIFLWICISQQWEKKDVLHRILVGLLPDQRGIRESMERWTEDEQVRKISSIMQSKKCIMMLDDVWSADVWQNLESAISIGNKGSKVLVSTRNVEVAKFIDAHGYIHRPRLLDKDESWELLSNKALHYRQGYLETEEMEELGKEMVDHCGGLPLALMILGGILASKSNYEDWQAVHKSVKSYLRKGKNIGEEEGDLHKILALSYYDLPYQLKPCFLYLSKYAEDEEIEAVTLYQIWMAEGMILSKDKIVNDETMMDVAQRYLGELAARCMVFVEMEELPTIQKFKSCHLHDLMRDLCILKAKEESFLELLVNGGDICNTSCFALSSSSATRATSRLAVYSTNAQTVVQPAEEVRRRLRSFSIVMNRKGYKGSMLRFDDFLMLRVLILEGLEPYDKHRPPLTSGEVIFKHQLQLPISIGELIHLRYLSLRYSAFVILSSSMSNLRQLETLDLRCRGTLKIFNVLWKFQSLKHLYLPTNLEIHSKRMVRCFESLLFRLDGLNKLEILHGFDNKCCNTKHLSTLKNLRSLTARPHNNGLKEFINQVSNLTSLQFLEIEIPGRFSDEVHLSLLKRIFSLSCLEQLVIQGNIRALPEYQNGFGQKLVSLKLSSDEMEEDPLSTLEKLPNLRALDLGNWWFGGEKVSCHASGFPKLKSLFIGKSYSLEMWEIENGAMAHLSRLTIDHCKRLKMIPDGLRFVTSLEELVIRRMPAEFVRRIKVNADGEEGEDFDKIRHIQKVIIDDLFSE